MISTRSVELLIDTVVCLTLAKWETVSGQFGGYLTISPGRSCPSRAAIGRARGTQCGDWYKTLGQRRRSSRLHGGRLASFYLFRFRNSKNRCTSALLYLFRSWQNELINYCAKVKRGSAHGKAHCSFQIRAIGRLGSVWPDCSLTPLSLSSHRFIRAITFYGTNIGVNDLTERFCPKRRGFAASN